MAPRLVLLAFVGIALGANVFVASEVQAQSTREPWIRTSCPSPTFDIESEERVTCGIGVACAAGSACIADRCVAPNGRVSAPVLIDRAYAARHCAHEITAYAGGVVFVLGWVLSVVSSSLVGYHPGLFGTTAGFEPGWDDVRFVGYVPLVGPWIQIAMGRNERLWTAFPALLGGWQLLGFGLLLLGIVLDENDAPLPSRFAIVPALSNDGVALSVSASF